MEKEHLTNEQLKKKFGSQFDLVIYAIKLAENMIKSGRGPRVRIDTQNPAMQVLAEISQGKDQFEEIIEKQDFDEKIVEKKETVSEAPVKEKKKLKKVALD